ncbi:DUF2334 domain-containing protein [Phocoenobacter skyensis]|uniref:DUF2334 domain-containing protein n=1 Tax=Phocoenobacter skyensis TaxID=97481 RepID=A0A1H7WIB6_9PAST|nr:DUF2334 domain-containing protein [Pasteurella skyensis]MDP8079229.1 DUF2334 domain-containing protein [Pasteurella skyensis]MDP8085161.1 DUF2334 domain-containing protein [Pasteurella skyensis]MDP8185078.1 DUF2334 domain-containing protein [Pasteurella skyensis]QLB22236.1 hypothetical protein A6B44_03085 [Pasteurella skyensis]SEM20779.1 hypothetical protein SAMN05444853_10849 [Pasteurella skyensis]
MKVKYLVRLDDACPTMDWQKWQRFEKILDEANIKPLVGVIPNNQDKMQMKDDANPNFWNVVKEWENKDWAIALHGNNHTYCMLRKNKGLNPINSFSEFVGKSLKEQKEIIKESWETFLSNGIEPKYFFAPGHSFDENTLKAMKEETNIRIVSDMIASKPYFEQGFTFIPCQMGSFRKIKLPGYYTACFHPNEMNDNAFNKVEKFISENREDFINFGELNLKSLSSLSLYDRFLRVLYFTMRRLKKVLK